MIQAGPMLTMSSRNAIVAQAIQTLREPYKADFLQYADRLSASIGDTVYVNFPPPPRIIGHASPAEICAINYLATGRGTLWTAIRETIALLEFASDSRPCANGMTYTLGAYHKGGILGLSKETAAHPATCRLLNMAVVAVERGHVWTTLAINVDNMTSVHQDRQNSFHPSLLIGVSHHEAGELALLPRGPRRQLTCRAHVPHQRGWCALQWQGLAARHMRLAGRLSSCNDRLQIPCAGQGSASIPRLAFCYHEWRSRLIKMLAAFTVVKLHDLALGKRIRRNSKNGHPHIHALWCSSGCSSGTVRAHGHLMACTPPSRIAAPRFQPLLGTPGRVALSTLLVWVTMARTPGTPCAQAYMSAPWGGLLPPMLGTLYRRSFVAVARRPAM